MLSINNDVKAVATAGVSAAAASVIAQHKTGIAKMISPAADTIVKTAKSTVSKDTYKRAGKAFGDAAAKAIKAAKTPKATAKKAAAMAGTAFKNAKNSIKEASKELGTAFKQLANAAFKGETYKNIGKGIAKFAKATGTAVKDEVKQFVKTTNWKTAGKFGLAALGVAAVIITAKNLLTKED